MAVPKQRKTKSRRNQRRSHINLKAPLLIKCPKCGKPVKPHTVCWSCGFYKGKEVIDVLAKLTKKEKKQKEKEMAVHKKEKAKDEGALSMEQLSKK
ncbi:50S ribosomal protein L32 [Candidatus Parcubacteria bacterium]|nr:50S ribosomal protein L32 [Candidatus Parcubacteria bacterium]